MSRIGRPVRGPRRVVVRVLLPLGVGAAVPLEAQSVRGRVLEEGTDLPVGGAFLEILAADSSRADATLTAPGGEFVLRTGGTGAYRLRLQRIGYGTWTSDAFDVEAGTSPSREVRVPVRPVRLTELRVDAESPCTVRPGAEAATARLWEEVRKALVQTAWAEEEELFRFTVQRWERRLDRELGETEEERTWRKPVRAAQPFVSLPAAELSEKGYVQQQEPEDARGAYVEFYAPDAAVLLSEQFLGTHCFSVRPGPYDRVDEVGLAFEPVPGRSLPEIEGVLWVDRRTAALDRLEFRYVNLPLPRSVETDPLGGEVRFRRLPDGGWIVSEWRLRMPILDRRHRRLLLVGVEEAGGRVVEVAPAPE